MRAATALTLLLLVAIPSGPVLLADTPQEDAEECSVCTARHKALQRLQAARAAQGCDAEDERTADCPQDADKGESLLPPPPAD